MRGIQGLDTFLTQTPSKLGGNDLRTHIEFVVLRGATFVLLSDGESHLHIDIAADPVIQLCNATPEVQARWKELEREVLRMS